MVTLPTIWANGKAVGTLVGTAVGATVGADVGPRVGADVGPLVGADVGLLVGEAGRGGRELNKVVRRG